MIGGRQREPIHFTARSQRQRVEHNKRRGRHVVGQLRKQMRAQLSSRGRFNLANHISHKSLISPLVFARDNYGFANLWVRCQCRFNLSQLDPEAAHFHLMIAPAAILDVSIRQETAQIPGAEKSCASVWTKWIGNKFFGG